MDYEIERFTFRDYIADDTKITYHSEMPYYARLPYYAQMPYYVEPGTKE